MWAPSGIFPPCGTSIRYRARGHRACHFPGRGRRTHNADYGRRIARGFSGVGGSVRWHATGRDRTSHAADETLQAEVWRPHPYDSPHGRERIRRSASRCGWVVRCGWMQYANKPARWKSRARRFYETSRNAYARRESAAACLTIWRRKSAGTKIAPSS